MTLRRHATIAAICLTVGLGFLAPTPATAAPRTGTPSEVRDPHISGLLGDVSNLASTSPRRDRVEVKLRNQYLDVALPGINTWPIKPLANSELTPPSTIAQEALQYAMSQVGDAYVALPSGAMNTGLSTNDESWDCSGLTWRAYYESGLNWPAMPSYSQMNSSYVTEVPVDQAQPGDLVFYDFLHDPEIIPRGLTGRDGVDHVAMVLDPAAGTVVEAANEAVGVRVGKYLNPDGSPVPAFISVGRVTEGNRIAAQEPIPPLIGKARFHKLIEAARQANKDHTYQRIISLHRSDMTTVTNPLTSPVTPLQVLKALPKAIEKNSWNHSMTRAPGQTVIELVDPKDPMWSATLTYHHPEWVMGTLSIDVTHSGISHVTRVISMKTPSGDLKG